ncbi:MAG: methyltransferase domain-containing protein [Phycisphaerales bacterium]|nr:methyltransferase domain-containing protein [Phycisphaerales bacterium]
MQKDILKQVQQSYAAVADSGLSNADAGVQAVAEAFGYGAADLASIPAAANMGLSCGNPTALAALKPGEVVVDLGCGGGLDVFLAAAKVGPMGKAIGIDMTESMIARARRNAAHGPNAQPYKNVEFILSTIENTTLPPDLADCVISNCVINLAPDKSAVLREIFRILRPGGRLAISDIALKKPLPPELAQDAAAYSGCIAGAIPIETYRQNLVDAGFADVRITQTGADLNAYSKADGAASCCASTSGSASGPSPSAGANTRLNVAAPNCCNAPLPAKPLHADIAELLRRYNINDYAMAVQLSAIKPAAPVR